MQSLQSADRSPAKMKGLRGANYPTAKPVKTDALKKKMFEILTQKHMVHQQMTFQKNYKK
jgi:hypothetical protein